MDACMYVCVCKCIEIVVPDHPAASFTQITNNELKLHEKTIPVDFYDFPLLSLEVTIHLLIYFYFLVNPAIHSFFFSDERFQSSMLIVLHLDSGNYTHICI